MGLGELEVNVFGDFLQREAQRDFRAQVGKKKKRRKGRDQGTTVCQAHGPRTVTLSSKERGKSSAGHPEAL